MKKLVFLFIAFLSIVSTEVHSSQRFFIEAFQAKKKKKKSTGTVQCKAIAKSTKKRCKNMTSSQSGL